MGEASRRRDSMSGKRQKSQMDLAFGVEGRGEASETLHGGTEPLTAERRSESPASTERLMEEVVEAGNLKKALKRVKANKGSPGIDGMTVEQLPGYLREHWPTHRTQLLSGSYRPQPVKRVEIAKPGGGKRQLSIPIWIGSFSRRFCRFCRADGTVRSRKAALASDRVARRIRPWPRRRSSSRKAAAGSWTLIWRSSSTESTTTC